MHEMPYECMSVYIWFYIHNQIISNIFVNMCIAFLCIRIRTLYILPESQLSSIYPGWQLRRLHPSALWPFPLEPQAPCASLLMNRTRETLGNDFQFIYG